MRERRSESLTVEISRPSMDIDPERGVIRRRSESVREDLPAPVRPTMPIRVPPETLNDTFFSTRGPVGEYATLRSWTSMDPFEGQTSGTDIPSCGSGEREVYSTMAAASSM